MSWRPLVCKKCPEDMSADLLQKVSNKQKWNNKNWSAWVVCSHLHCWYQVMAFSNILNFRKLLMHISIVLQQAEFLVYLFITSVNHAWKLMPESNLKMLLYPIAVIMTSSKAQRTLVAVNYAQLGSQPFLSGYLSLSFYQQKKMREPKQNRKMLILKCELLTRAKASLYVHTRLFYNLKRREEGGEFKQRM